MRIERPTRVYIAGCGGMVSDVVHQPWSAQCEVVATDIDVNESSLGRAASEYARRCK